MGPAALLSVDPFRPCENSLSPKLYLFKDGNFSTLHQSSIASPLNPPVGIKTPAARAALPVPRASHVPARRVPPAAARFLLPRSATYPMVLRCRSLDQSWHGPSAYSTRISSAPKPATGSGRRSLEILPKRAAPAPSPRKGQWLQSPSRTLCRRLPEFDPQLRGVPVKPFLHQGLDKPHDSTIASDKRHS